MLKSEMLFQKIYEFAKSIDPVAGPIRLTIHLGPPPLHPTCFLALATYGA